ncbi:MAG: hypothetical protein ABSE82_12850 [Nitrososphaerales archaeon]|jgi:hypothetical protein
MLKRILSWKYLVAVVIILGGCIYVSRQDQKTHDQYEQKCNQFNARAVPPSGHQEDCAKGADNAAGHLPSWYRAFSWPEGITTLSLLLTLLVIAEQTAQTRKAAEAALLNAQALINAERPWIMVTVEEVTGRSGGFNLYMTNKGRTPAMVTGAYIGCVAVKDISSLPTKSPYGPGSMATDRIVLQGEKLPVTWFDGTTLKKIVGNGFPSAPWDGDIFVFGKVLYRDLLSPSTNPLHETRWIGLYQLPSGESSDSIFSFQGIGVPDEYDRYS